jgi:hypothetical protein
VALSVDTRKIVWAKVISWEEGEWGIAWKAGDGYQGMDRIGTKSDAQAVVRDINQQRAAAFATAPLKYRSRA